MLLVAPQSLHVVIVTDSDITCRESVTTCDSGDMQSPTQTRTVVACGDTYTITLYGQDLDMR